MKLFKTKVSTSILLLIIGASMMTLNGQQLNKHRWENRLLLILSKTDSSSTYLSQLKLLKGSDNEFNERRLQTYTILPKTYRTSTAKEWIQDSTLFSKFNSEDHAFKIILIGLDGGIKLERTTLLPPKELCTFIDGMPMRQRELRIKNK